MLTHMPNKNATIINVAIPIDLHRDLIAIVDRFRAETGTSQVFINTLLVRALSGIARQHTIDLAIAKKCVVDQKSNKDVLKEFVLYVKERLSDDHYVLDANNRVMSNADKEVKFARPDHLLELQELLESWLGLKPWVWPERRQSGRGVGEWRPPHSLRWTFLKALSGVKSEEEFKIKLKEHHLKLVNHDDGETIQWMVKTEGKKWGDHLVKAEALGLTVHEEEKLDLRRDALSELWKQGLPAATIPDHMTTHFRTLAAAKKHKPSQKK